MKKSFVISAALALAFLSAQAFAFDTETTLKVTGSAKEYTKTVYQITEKFGDYYRSPRAKFVHVFDASGREIESSELTSKDALIDRITYKYEGRNLVETVCTDVDGKILWKVTKAYDANGNKTEESEFNASDALVNKTIWKINGKQLEESYYNADGSLLSKIITKNDDQDRIAEVAQYLSTGALEQKAVYTYNDAGKLSEIAYTDGNGVQTKKVVFRFDATYQITEEQTYSSENKLVVRVIYKYDALGNIIKTTTYNVAEKFGTTVNELAGISEYTYGAAAVPATATTTPKTTVDAK
jgi:antitoxin component YwqK of YwqJK toxin-antitoxin module